MLDFTESKINGVDRTLMLRTSLASCEDAPDRMYAVAEAADSMILAVLSSRDGGATWGTAQMPNRALAGDKGGFHQCIAVSPQRPDLVVIGWQAQDRSGRRTAPNHGANPTSLKQMNICTQICTRLPRSQPGGPEPLYVGGDGGIVVTRDLGQTYHSQFNRPLNNLQFYGGARTTFLGSYGGSLTASSRYPGLLAGGTQDNGNVYRCPDRHRDGVPRQADTPWLRHVGGDGDLNRFVDPLGVLLDFSNGDTSLPKNPVPDSTWPSGTRRQPLSDGPDRPGR